MRAILAEMVMRFALSLALAACVTLAGCGGDGRQSAVRQTGTSAIGNSGLSVIDNTMSVPEPADLSFDELHLPDASEYDPGGVPKIPGALRAGYFDEEAILGQLSRKQLITALVSDYGYSFVADLDRDEHMEDYRTGWVVYANGRRRQMLSVYEDGRIRDTWVTDGGELLAISWHHGEPILYDCNCPMHAPIVYQGNRLHMKWIGDGEYGR